jgi:hypothetical protein
MKKLLILSTLCTLNSIFSSIWGQGGGDSLRYSQETGTLEKQAFVNASDYVFMAREEAKWLVKTNYGAMLTNRSILGDFEYTLEIGGEVKLTPSIAINGLLGYNHKSEQAIRGFWYGQIEPRWYYNMPKRIAQGRSTNNFSGNYFSLKFTQFTDRSKEGFPSERDFKTPHQRLMLAYGMQRRVLNYGFFDFSLNAGWQRDNNYEGQYVLNGGRYRPVSWQNNPLEGFSARSEIRLGLALGGAKRKTTLPVCDIFRCFEEENSLFKIDMTKLFYVAPNQANLTFSMAYEKKLKKTAWSLNQELRADYSYSFEKYSDGYAMTTIESNGTMFRYVLEPRYYYNLNKRIRKGKSANNLSGNYLALHNFNRLSHTFLEIRPGNEPNRKQLVTAIGAVWGIQRRMFNHGFFDAKFGIVRKLNERFHDFLIPGVEPVLDIKIGFAF